MIRILMASTALTAMLAGPMAVPALAQSETTQQQNTEMQKSPDAATEMDKKAGDMDRYDSLTSVKGATIGSEAVEGYLASNLMGSYVYSSNAEDAEIVGDINDLLVTDSGEIRAVIVGVGGFLGIGEKDVAIDFDRLALEQYGESGFRLVANVSKEDLENTNEFELEHRTPMGDAEMKTDGKAEMKTAATDQKKPIDDQAKSDTEIQASAESEAQSDEKSPDQRVADAGEDAKPTDTENKTITAMPAEKAEWEKDPRWTDADREFVNTVEYVDAKQLTAEEMLGTSVYGSNRENVGEIGDVLMTDDGQADAVVIDVGGFLGLGEKPVAVGFESVKFYREDNGGLTVMTPFSEDELENAQVFDEENYKSKRDAIVLNR
ncbi:MAG TPA: PRC-barrel domain-containing protein [Afifellaceae bacterium]|nr:PRC-barrel domain-containing protein [Afifellaceae bacterium]